MIQNKLKGGSDQRSYTIIYNDFLESDLLTKDEKLVFIVLKRYCNIETMTAFPSVSRIAKLTKVSENGVRNAIKGMEKKGVLSIERRKYKDKDGYMTNIYTLHDYRSIWSGESTEPTDEELEQRCIDILRKKGYRIEKESATADQSKVTDPQKNNLSGIQYKDKSRKSQSNKFKNFPERQYTPEDYQALELLGMMGK